MVKSPRVSFVSLGCPKNLVDSEKMLGTLADAGCHIVNEDQSPDAIIINTCGFLEASKDESLAVIHDAIDRKNAGDLSRVVVAGCLVQRHRAQLLDWAPGIDAMIGVFDRDHILDAVSPATTDAREAAAGSSEAAPYWIAGNALQAARARDMNVVGLTVNGADGNGIGYFEDDSNRFRLTPRHWAYLRVSEGCNQKCAFCTIPSIRGKMRSKPLDTILTEANALMTDGAFELNLIGQDTTSYGYDIDPTRETDLIKLLTGLNGVAEKHGGGWIRLMYVYPTYFTDAMIDAIADLPHICNYIDIPLQHMSDNMLTAMRRNISAAEQETLLHKLRARIPGVAIRTTFITGFPGETEADHDQLLDFIADFQFDMLGVFQYSRENNTPAGTMDMDPALHVPDAIKAEREADIMLTQQNIAFANAQYLAEQSAQFDILIDEPNDDETDAHHYRGRAYHQAPQVDSLTHIISTEPLSPGQLIRCTITDSDQYDLIAQPTHQLTNNVSLPVI